MSNIGNADSDSPAPSAMIVVQMSRWFTVQLEYGCIQEGHCICNAVALQVTVCGYSELSV